MGLTELVIIGGMIAYKAIDKLEEKAKNILQKASGEQEKVIARITQDIFLILENLKTNYKGNLEFTVDKVDDIFKTNLYLVESILANLESKMAQDVHEVTDKTQHILDTLPFRGIQIYRIDPKNIILKSEDEQTRLAIIGRFPSRCGSVKAVLRLGERRFASLSETQGSLTFKVPTHFLREHIKNSSFATVESTVYFYKSMWIFAPQFEGKFKLLWPIINNSPGKVSLEVKTVRKVVQVEKKTSPLFSQCVSGGQMSKLHYATPDQHWKVVKGTSTPQMRKNIGNNALHFVSESDSEICYRAVSISRKKKCPSDCAFQILFDQMQEIAIEEIEKIAIPLNWGDQKVYDLPAGSSWKVVFNSYDGSHFETATQEFTHPVLRVEQKGNQLQIGTYPPTSHPNPLSKL